jgi:hypothetical protein
LVFLFGVNLLDVEGCGRLDDKIGCVVS